MTTTPTELYGITKEQWFDFEELRRSGRTNMWAAAPYLSFDHLPIMDREHYLEMRAAWGAEFEATHVS